MITYTLNTQPVQRSTQENATTAAKITGEIFERLQELEEIKFGSGHDLTRRLATLAELSSTAFRTVIRFGAGDTGWILRSFQEQAANRGRTRQALHWEYKQDLKAISMVFPEVARVIDECRQSLQHKEGAMSSDDALRDADEAAHEKASAEPKREGVQNEV